MAKLLLRRLVVEVAVIAPATARTSQNVTTSSLCLRTNG